MKGKTNIFNLQQADRVKLENWVGSAKTEQRLALRARIILRVALGQTHGAVAEALGVREATVSKWRVRFAQAGPAGLLDAAGIEESRRS